MTNQDTPKKMSLQDAIKQKLASKNQTQTAAGKASSGPVKNLQAMQSQVTKKPNNQRKRMGV